MKLYSPGRRLSSIITSKHFEKIRYKRLVCSELQDFKLVAIDNMLAACMYYKQFAYFCLIVRLSFSVIEATYSRSWAYLQQMCPLRLLLYFVVTQKKKRKQDFFRKGTLNVSTIRDYSPAVSPRLFCQLSKLIYSSFESSSTSDVFSKSNINDSI